MSIFRTQDATKWPDSVLEASTLVPNLEEHTGADLLISPLALPLRDINPSIPCQNIFRRHLAKGMLIQVKRGQDFINSIEHLADVERRMLETGCKLNWLLVIADIKVDKDGQCILDGRATGWTYASVEGALVWWQLRGAYYTVLSRDALIAGWVNGWLERLKKLDQEPLMKVIRRYPRQMLAGPDWTDTLATIPGIGKDRAEKIADYCGSLANAMIYLSDPTSNHLDGIGPKTFESARRYLGLAEGYELAIQQSDKEES